MIVYVDVKDIVNGRVRHVTIKYVASDVPSGQVTRINYNKETYTITIGIGKRTEESTFTRDIANDVIKGVGCREAKATKKHNLRLKDGKIERIEFVGTGHVTNLTVANIRYEVRSVGKDFFNVLLNSNSFRLISTMRRTGLKSIKMRVENGQFELRKSLKVIRLYNRVGLVLWLRDKLSRSWSERHKQQERYVFGKRHKKL